MEQAEFERLQKKLRQRDSLRIIAENQPPVETPVLKPWPWYIRYPVVAIFYYIVLGFWGLAIYGGYTLINDLKEAYQ